MVSAQIIRIVYENTALATIQRRAIKGTLLFVQPHVAYLCAGGEKCSRKYCFRGHLTPYIHAAIRFGKWNRNYSSAELKKDVPHFQFYAKSKR